MSEQVASPTPSFTPTPSNKPLHDLLQEVLDIRFPNVNTNINNLSGAEINIAREFLAFLAKAAPCNPKGGKGGCAAKAPPPPPPSPSNTPSNTPTPTDPKIPKVLLGPNTALPQLGVGINSESSAGFEAVPAGGLSLWSVDQFVKGLGGTTYNGSNISLAGVELNYMGSSGNPLGARIARHKTSKVCMPGQKEGQVYRGYLPNQSTPGQYETYPWTYKIPGDWNSTDPSLGTPWRPAGMEEFVDSYENNVGANAYPQATNEITAGSIIVEATGGNPVNPSTGTNTPQDYNCYITTLGLWAVIAKGKTQFSTPKNFSSTWYVFDHLHCMGNFELGGSVNYP